MPSTYTGVDFANQLKPDVSTRFNLLDYDYYYNGAGVAIADLDNDGLEDLIFTGNEVENRIYKNLGDLKFTDVTAISGLQDHQQWSNGVTVADVDADGFLDIYLSQGGPVQSSQRKNRLYINQGEMRFKEVAESVGLADDGISSQSVFLDYDNDGDLDCYVMNESEVYGYDIIPYYRQLITDSTAWYNNSSHLYRNDSGRFTDVSKESGILHPSFGLGVCVLDVNDDGRLDIYQANDYYVPDVLWVNQGDGTFINEIKARTQHMSFYGMGVDAGDLDGDGNEDLVVLDMASTDHVRAKTLMASMNVETFDMMVKNMEMPHQYMYNSVQLSDGAGSYDEVSHLLGLAKTDWSWAPLVLDYDLDGYNDLYVTNGYRKYALDNDFRQKVKDTQLAYRGEVPNKVKQELYDLIPEEKLPNLLYRQNSRLSFVEMANASGMDQPTYSNGAAYSDLDNDGDLDIVVNVMDDEALVYRNNANQGPNHYLQIQVSGPTSESFARVELWTSIDRHVAVARRVTGYRSSVSPIVSIGLGKEMHVDSLRVTWPDGARVVRKQVDVDRRIVIDYPGQAPNKADGAASITESLLEQVSLGDYGLYYRHRENSYDDLITEVLLPYRQSRLGPRLVSADWNGDGLEDLWCSSSHGSPPKTFIQTPSNKFVPLSLGDIAQSSAEESDIALIDIDKDGDLDVFVAHGGNEFKPGHDSYANKLYENQDGNYVVDERYEDLIKASTSRVINWDLDKDGDLDLVVLNRLIPQSYPLGAGLAILINEDGQLIDRSQTWLADVEITGLLNDAIITSSDKLLLVGEWMSPLLLSATDGRLVPSSLPTDEKSGWWFSVAEADITGDGHEDLILGNLGLNSKYQASDSKPLRVYGSDLDGSGTHDVVLAQRYGNEYVPFRGRECSSEQMPMIKEKFPTYRSFATASLKDVYGAALDTAYVATANYFESVILINDGSGSYELVSLPKILQMRPMLDIAITDVDHDGVDDCIAVGNIYSTEPETPRLDASRQYVLSAPGKNIQARPLSHFTKGDIKTITIITTKEDEDILVVGTNNGLLSLYK